MAKQTSGYVFEEDGRWYARFTYTDRTGRRRNVKRRAESKSQAREILKQLIDGFEQQGSQSLDAARMTFGNLADFYAENYLRPAEFVEGRKVTGLRDWKHPQAYLKLFRERFGRHRLRDITHEDIRVFRSERLRTTTQRKTQRSITTVNRELAYLRRIFNVAHRNGWILKNPFTTGDTLICLAAERKRERILTRDEEERLLAACIGRRKHLRAIIICALDTGMRLGEILSLRWYDVNLANRLLTIRAHNTKTERERQVSLTSRLFTELELLSARAVGSKGLVFGFKSNVRTSFEGVRAVAGLPDVRFHDLRHTAATRLDEEGAWITSAFDSGSYPEILYQYPSSFFSLEITYRQRDGRLGMETVAHNTGDREMPVGFGIHPYFRRPAKGSVTVPADGRWELSDSLPTGRMKATTT